jgi:GMP synthase (glutamine-hydrolysing)
MWMKTALVVRHVVFEGVAGYREPIEAAGYEIERIPACETDWATLDILSPDLLVVMGGPMGAYETGEHPWLAAEIDAIRTRLAADRPTLGVCLGSQLIAAALSARVYPGPVREIGFSPLALTAASAGSPLRHVEGVDVLHWHGDTFDLPDGVDLLASTPAFPNQAFRRGSNLLALQFHAEMGEDPRFHEWIEEGRDYLAGAKVDPVALSADHDRLGPPAVRAGRAMIAEWLVGL